MRRDVTKSEEMVNVMIIEDAKGRVLLDLVEDSKKDLVPDKEETETGGFELGRGGGGKDGDGG
jgi:hypothetical protein